MNTHHGASPGPVILETGAMPSDSRFYIRRKVDDIADICLESMNPTLVLKASRHSGRSSLLSRLHFAAIDRGEKSCYLNLTDLDESTLASPVKLFPALARMISDAIEIDSKSGDYPSRRLGPMEGMTRFLEKEVLESGSTPVLLLFDEVDIVTRYPECGLALFSMLRGWHNRRSTDRKGRWMKLRMVITHAADTSLWIPDLNQSPFNVGLNVTLDDFDEVQVADLNRRLGGPLKDEEVGRLMALVGGHPFLIRLSLHKLATNEYSLARLEGSAVATDGLFAGYLKQVFGRVWSKSEYQPSLLQVLEEGKCDDESHFQRFWSEGLVLGNSRTAVRMRCRLFEQYVPYLRD
jgi:AAA-like domain